MKARILGKRDDGTVDIDFGVPPEKVFALADEFGEVPVPPYVEPTEENTSTYQTVYAKHVGSVAAPTAGFHFTPALLDTLEKKGVETAFVTLHVGLGTFRPIKNDTLEEHEMHEEWAHVPKATREAIARAKQGGRRVIVVGTTAMRALESIPLDEIETQRGWDGFTKLFITPGYTFNIADGLITNFHLPKSTLLVLVSAFAGREHTLNTYKHAIDNDYRFYSFGDAMLIV
jgi:S-adenosylmethionine:tRNA ribosyltransferase-isomerase